MLKVQRADHTRKSVVAVQKILNMTKRRTITLRDVVSNPSKDLLSKKVYMQSDEFWKDPHNVKMFNLAEKLMKMRDKIASQITESNKSNEEKLEQGINGFARIKRALLANNELNFNNFPSFVDSAEAEYAVLKMRQIGDLSKKAKSELNIK